MKVIKNESPLRESLKNVHWVLSHKVGVYIELGSPSGGIANLSEKPCRQIWRAAIYRHTHIYLCIHIYVMRSKISPTGGGARNIQGLIATRSETPTCYLWWQCWIVVSRL